MQATRSVQRLSIPLANPLGVFLMRQFILGLPSDLMNAARLDGMSLETKERYYAGLSALTAKLETGEKPLREIMQEMMAEAASLILQEMQA